MSRLGCTCGNSIPDHTDFLPYKAYIREDEDTEKPIELLADVLERFWAAREQGRLADFLRECAHSRSNGDMAAEWEVTYYQDKPLSDVLAHLIFPFWNNYDRTIYECEECGRLWIQVGRNRFVAYLP